MESRAAKASLALLSCVALLTQISLPVQISAQVSGLAGTQSNSWIDSLTGHRVIKLTPENDSKGLYFNQNAFTPDGTKMIYTAVPDRTNAQQGIYVVDLATVASRQLVAPPVETLIVGHKSPIVYFMRPNDRNLYAVGVNTGQISKIAELPARANISTLNADETLVAGTYTEVDPPAHALDRNLKISSIRATQMDARLADHVPMVIFTLNLRTAEITKVIHSTDWLNHVQFSPKEPSLLMYCHEGLWWKVDRIWTIHTDGTGNQLIHKRIVNNEIAGHEFWDADGVTVWYDLQIPRGQNFYLASYNTNTGARKWYSVERDAWSIHYNATPDDKLFCGDGGDYAQVAKSKNGQWIELFSPRESPVPTEIETRDLVQSGFLVSQHLVNLSKQNYMLEPNVRFSPDKKWVIFTSNMLGPSYVYAVEVAKASPVAAP